MSIALAVATMQDDLGSAADPPNLLGLRFFSIPPEQPAKAAPVHQCPVHERGLLLTGIGTL